MLSALHLAEASVPLQASLAASQDVIRDSGEDIPQRMRPPQAKDK
jgi:hypothetical protein